MERERAMLEIPKRLPNANKGSYGKLLILAGSEGMAGAAYFSALAAYRSGAGLVRIISCESNRGVLQNLIPEAVLRLYGEETDLKRFMERETAWADFCVAGPGLGVEESSAELLEGLLLYGKTPLLLDADGLNLLSRREKLHQLFQDYALRAPVLVTPHPMELSRLLHQDIKEVLADPEKAGRRCSLENHCISLVKGAKTLVLRAEAPERYFQNPEPSPALSKAGSGDVLSGCIAGIFEILKAEQKEKGLEIAAEELLFRAGCIGVMVHAMAGRLAAEELGEHSVLARDTANALGRALAFFEERR